MITTGAKTAKAANADKRAAGSGPATEWWDRVEAADWDTIRANLDNYGCALTGPLLCPDEAAERSPTRLARSVSSTPVSAPQRFAQRLPSSGFDLRGDPISTLGCLGEPRQEKGLAHASHAVQHDRLGGSPAVNAIKGHAPAASETL